MIHYYAYVNTPADIFAGYVKKHRQTHTLQRNGKPGENKRKKLHS